MGFWGHSSGGQGADEPLARSHSTRANRSVIVTTPGSGGRKPHAAGHDRPVGGQRFAQRRHVRGERARSARFDCAQHHGSAAWCSTARRCPAAGLRRRGTRCARCATRARARPYGGRARAAPARRRAHDDRPGPASLSGRHCRARLSRSARSRSAPAPTSMSPRAQRSPSSTGRGRVLLEKLRPNVGAAARQLAIERAPVEALDVSRARFDPRTCLSRGSRPGRSSGGASAAASGLAASSISRSVGSSADERVRRSMAAPEP